MKMVYPQVAALCIILATAACASAQTAGMQSFQGRLKQNGTAISGAVSLEFRIYDDPTAGSLKAGPYIASTTANTGLVSTKFGPVLPSAFDGTSRWLEVKITSPTPVTTLPRLNLATSPATAEQLNRPGTGVGAAFVDGSGNLSIGTATPTSRLTVVDNTNANHIVSQFIGFGNSGGDSSAYLALKHGAANENWAFRAYPTGEFAIHQAGQADRIFFRADGAVGIGTSNPGNTLSVGGHADFAGYVGIGTGVISPPQAKLHIAGTPGVDGIKFPDGKLQTTASNGVFADGLNGIHTGNVDYPTSFVTLADSAKTMILPSGTAIINWSLTAYDEWGVNVKAQFRPVIGSSIGPVTSFTFPGQSRFTVCGSWVTQVSAGTAIVQIQVRSASASQTPIVTDVDDSLSWNLLVVRN